jgi:hypothetical protein
MADSRFYAQTCPTCQGSDVHRSHARSFAERMRKSMTHERLFRCHGCGWRGWQEPNDVVVSGAHAARDQPDLDALDAFAEAGSAVPAAFSPRSLP